jgi:renalase
MVHDVIVIGAGVAGLQCARRLSASGADVLLLDRADKVGGRCVSRLFEGRTVDYGPLFFHGSDAGFLAALASIAGARPLHGWPSRIEGRGTPCQPDAFAPFEKRMAFAEGLNAFPQALAADLTVRLRVQIAAIASRSGTMAAESSEGELFRARELVLALALEQSLPFLTMLPVSVERDGALALLAMFASVPCLTVIASYPPAAPAPRWDICYPEDDPALLLIGNESAKRPDGRSLTLVYQAVPRWSRERLEQPPDSWSRELLGHAARRVGAWAAAPERVHLHRWRYARLDRANELAGPLELHAAGCRVSLAGDLFAAGGGMQAAWLSGERLAARIQARASA